MAYKFLLCITALVVTCGDFMASNVCISDIYISGNKKTKEFTILRELPFRKGDIMPEDELIHQIEVAYEHLNNTSLFNYIYIDYIPDTLNRSDCLSCVVAISVEERWYYWPQVSLKLEDRNFSSWLHERDFSRITIGWGLRVYNVFGMRHKITVSDYFGYEKGGRIAYSNIALDKGRTQMLGFSASVLFNKTMNLFSENDKVVYVKNPDEFLDRTINGTISYSYRPRLRTTHLVEMGFNRTLLHDSVLIINKNYYGTGNTRNNTFLFRYNYSYEHRDYIVYPTKGYYIGAEFCSALADKMHFFYSEIGVKLQYFRPLSKRWFWSSRFNAATTYKNKRAYIYDQHVGYDENYITGYDYYVADGQRYAIVNNDLRFLLLPKTVFNMSYIRGLSKFKKIHFTIYAKAMFDMGYVYDKYRHPTNSLANTYVWGSGVGIDIVTYYDIVLNCSYAVNKMGEKGFFFGVQAPIF